jgi:MFS family permease
LADDSNEINNKKNVPNMNSNQGNATNSPWGLLLILSSISIMVMYVETMLLPAIPDIIGEFGLTYSASSWVFTSFIISALISTTIVSKLSDIYGRKLILLIVLAIYITGIIGGALADNIFMLIVFRIVQGIGMSIFPIVFTIVQFQFPKDKISIGQGTLASMFAFGGILGLIVGGNITHIFGWRMTFISILPFAVIVTIIIKCFVNIKHHTPIGNEGRNSLSPPTTNKHMQKRDVRSNCGLDFDVKGTFVLSLAITSFILALTLVESERYATDTINAPLAQISFFVTSIISIFVFIIVERKSPKPIIDLKLITLKPILLTNVIVIIWGIATFAIFQSIPVLVRTPLPIGIGGNALDVVYMTLPFSIMSLIFGPTSGFIISKIGSSKVILAGSMLTTVGFIGILILHYDALQIAVNLAIIGSGLSLLNVGQININTASTPFEYMGISFGINTLFRFMGSAIGPAFAGMFMQANQTIVNTSYGTDIVSFPSAMSFVNIFFCMSILSAVTVYLSVIVKR